VNGRNVNRLMRLLGSADELSSTQCPRDSISPHLPRVEDVRDLMATEGFRRVESRHDGHSGSPPTLLATTSPLSVRAKSRPW
jgi:hypothetical protein